MNHKLVLLAVAACGTSASSGTTMSGQNAFDVTTTVMVPRAFHCSPGTLDGGNAVTVVATDVDAEATGCASDPEQSETLPDHLEIQIATGTSAALAPGSFPIVDEGVSDEDLCGNVPAGTTGPVAIAMVSHCPSAASCNKELYATSGSVVVTSVSATSVEGTFDVTLVNSDREPQGSLTGSFVADVCP